MFGDDTSKRGGGGSTNPINRTLQMVFFIGVIAYAIQLYLNPEERRDEVACLPPYRVANLVMVTIPRYVMPRNSGFVVENIARTERLYFACKHYARKLPRVGP